MNQPTEATVNYRFRKRPVVIEAFQMTKERRQDRSQWPDWLRYRAEWVTYLTDNVWIVHEPERHRASLHARHLRGNL